MIPYLIVDFSIGARNFKLIRALATVDMIKNSMQTENHESRILLCPNHGICLPTANLQTNRDHKWM